MKFGKGKRALAWIIFHRGADEWKRDSIIFWAWKAYCDRFKISYSSGFTYGTHLSSSPFLSRSSLLYFTVGRAPARHRSALQSIQVYARVPSVVTCGLCVSAQVRAFTFSSAKPHVHKYVRDLVKHELCLRSSPSFEHIRTVVSRVIKRWFFLFRQVRKHSCVLH